MRHFLMIALAAVAGFAGTEAPAQQRQGPEVLGPLVQRADCERTCLEGLMNRYLDALVAHDPSRLPLAPHYKFTENTNEMVLGDGLWGTVDSLLPQKIFISDPATGQIAFYGGVMENGQLAMLNVRLKELAGQITEIETGVIRKVSGIHGDFTALKTPPAAWTETLTPSQRRPRQVLIALVNQYFEGIEQSNGDIVPFADDCLRWENNVQTAPSPSSVSATPATGSSDHAPVPVTNSGQLNMGPLTCGSQFNTGIFKYIPHITDRRFLLVDEERGIVFASVMFQHPGSVRYVDVPGKGRVEMHGMLAMFPNTTNILEAFRVKNGKITNIHAYVNLLPYRQKPGW